jgi:hypothetical protein
VIADLGVNHFERHALLCGFTVQRTTHDYGIDLWLATYNRTGEVENGEIRVQLKATDHLKHAPDGQAILFRVRRRDLHHWLSEAMPVILVVYDAKADVAYWLYIQEYFQALPGFDLAAAGERVTVNIPRANAVNRPAIRKFAKCRDRIQAQLEGVVRHA